MNAFTRSVIACALALCVLISGAARADSLAMGYWNDIPVFVVEYDDKLFDIDYDDRLYENEENYIWQFVLYNDSVYIDFGIEYLSEYANTRFFDMDDNALMEYAEDIADYWPASKFVEIMRVKVTNAAQTAYIPFVILMFTYKDGSKTYFAETITNGYSIFAEMSEGREHTLNDDDLNTLKSILSSFAPIDV